MLNAGNSEQPGGAFVLLPFGEIMFENAFCTAVKELMYGAEPLIRMFWRVADCYYLALEQSCDGWTHCPYGATQHLVTMSCLPSVPQEIGCCTVFPH